MRSALVAVPAPFAELASVHRRRPRPDPLDSRRMPEPRFAMAIARRPISVNKKGRSTRYVEEIRGDARAHWDRAPIDGPTYVRVLWFHRSATSQDIDNILKRIVDGLEGVVYRDDRVVVRCMAARVPMSERITLPSDATESPAFDELSELLSRQPAHILYVEVGSVSDPRRFALGTVA